MIFCQRTIAVLLIVAGFCLASPVSGQEIERMFVDRHTYRRLGFSSPPAKYIRYWNEFQNAVGKPWIQSELGLSEDQRKRLADRPIDQELLRISKLYPMKRGGWPDHELAILGPHYERTNRMLDRHVLNILNDSQKKRLRKLVFCEFIYRYGLTDVLLEEFVSAKLGLTKTQRHRIAAAGWREIQKIVELKKDLNILVRDELEKALTSAQRKKVDQILGENKPIPGWDRRDHWDWINLLAKDVDSEQVAKLKKANPRWKKPGYETVAVNGNGNDQFYELFDSTVQKQIELTGEQIRDLKKLKDQLISNRDKIVNDFFEGSDSSRNWPPEKTERYGAALRAANEDAHNIAFDEILLPHQRDFFKNTQIRKKVYQTGLFKALLDESEDGLGKQIGFKAQQKQRLIAARARLFEKLLERESKFQQEFFRVSLEPLTADQRQTVNQWIGKKPPRLFPELKLMKIQLEGALIMHKFRKQDLNDDPMHESARDKNR